MKNRRIGHSVIFVLLAAIIIWRTFSSSVEKEVTAMLTDMAETVSFNQPLQALEQLSRAKKLSSYFVDVIEVEFVLDGDYHLELKNNKEVQEKSLLLFSKLKSFEFGFRDIDFMPNDKNVMVQVSAHALGEGGADEGRFLESHRLEVQLIEKDSNWRIIKMQHLANLRD